MTERTQEQIVENIIQVLDDYVAPAVAGHGGQVNFVSFEEGKVLLEMSGACSGCAGSTMTLKYGAEQILTQMVPEVIAVDGFDDPFSEVDPFYTDPFGMHDWDLIDLEEEDSDESDNK
jgi:Fe-S cluster biogenesis protein NfuA